MRVLRSSTARSPARGGGGGGAGGVSTRSSVKRRSGAHSARISVEISDDPDEEEEPQAEPKSLADMPTLWLYALLHRKRCSQQTAVALLRTCRTLRDLVLDARRLQVRMAIPPRSSASMLRAQRRLSTAARLSSNVMLVFAARLPDEHDTDSDDEDEGDSDEEDDDAESDDEVVEEEGDGPLPGQHRRWCTVEPSMSHLLLRAMAEGAQALHGVRAVRFVGMELSAAIPSWLTLPCPGLLHLSAHHCIVAAGCRVDDLLATCPELTSLEWHGGAVWPQLLQAPDGGAPPAQQQQRRLAQAAERLRQQLTLLPSLSQLHVHEWPAAAPDALHSAQLTRLRVGARACAGAVRRLPAQFPALRELWLAGTTLDDGGVQALLRLPRLAVLAADGVNVAHDYSQRACTWQRLCVLKLSVASFARLPLERIGSAASICAGGAPRDTVALTASSDAKAVARVEAALRRWGGLGGDAGAPLHVSLHGSARAVDASLALLAALPQLQQVDVVGVTGVSKRLLRHLGRLLPPGVLEVALINCVLEAQSWPALATLPRVPTLSLHCFALTPRPTAAQLAAVCLAAKRPLRVNLLGVALSPADRALIRQMTRSVDARYVELALLDDDDALGPPDVAWLFEESSSEDDDDVDAGDPDFDDDDEEEEDD